ncbi:hypothetical protein AMJ74_02885 [candidate division WOR_3 bacterium SM1_77]|uniref:Uncharacterized protein n=1 Tax=candidate division WOR_3 bacterium SM1_77 TaxID=1703778 RepID=A0A0S8JZF3_UNCW3|nr:MAG: hypothetical protein AMJ74_02885 [candidate division WOR_3 bacterium SM1_77]
MKLWLKYANLLAIAGTAWMACVIFTMRISPVLVRSFSGYHSVRIVLALTEIIFSLFLLFFFICLLIYNSRVKSHMRAGYTTWAAVLGALWMLLVAILHRFPTCWRWFATQGSGLVLTVTQVVFTLPFLIFFILFYLKFNDGDYTIRLHAATIVAIVGAAWLLLVSATRISPVVWRWLIHSGIRKFMIITEPLVAFSLLFFLIMFYFEPEI